MKITSDLLTERRRFRGRSWLMIRMLPDLEDLQFAEGRRAQLGRPAATFELPRNAVEFHPDIYALVVLLLVQPFTAKRIVLDQPVSPQFAELVQQRLGLEIGPISSSIEQRRPPESARDAIAFSGGVDSCVALWLAPRSAIGVFLDRRAGRNAVAGLYRPDAAYRTIAAVRRARRSILGVRTDLELVRNPVGFPVDWSNAVPSLLLADTMGFASVGFGMVAESAFAHGNVAFSELRSRTVYSAWAPLFDHVGVPLSLPTASLSEVMTSRIALAHLRAWHPQSCVRGTADQPCGRCFKCFRKTLLESAITATPVADEHFDRAMESREVKRKLSESPVHHEGVLAYSMQGMPRSEHPLAVVLDELMAPTIEHGDGLRMLEHQYAPAASYVAPHLRDHVTSRILSETRSMSSEEEDLFRAWNLREVTPDPRYRAARHRLEQLLGQPEVAH